MISTNTWLRIICSMMINAVLFGTGAILVLTIPALAAHAQYTLPGVILLSFVAAPALAALVAPRMRIRSWGRQAWRDGDLISG